MVHVNGKGQLYDVNGRPLEVRGKQMTDRHLTPDEVAHRIYAREHTDYEEAAKKCFRMAAFGQKCNWPTNITDDLLLFGTLLGEISVAKKEGIIKNA